MTTYPAPMKTAPQSLPPVTPTGFKDLGVAYILLFWFSTLGVHKFYMGKAGIGVLYICTFGLFGIGVIIDIFTLTTQVREANAKIAQRGF